MFVQHIKDYNLNKNTFQTTLLFCLCVYNPLKANNSPPRQTTNWHQKKLLEEELWLISSVIIIESRFRAYIVGRIGTRICLSTIFVNSREV